MIRFGGTLSLRFFFWKSDKNVSLELRGREKPLRVWNRARVNSDACVGTSSGCYSDFKGRGRAGKRVETLRGGSVGVRGHRRVGESEWNSQGFKCGALHRQRWWAAGGPRRPAALVVFSLKLWRRSESLCNCATLKMPWTHGNWFRTYPRVMQVKLKSDKGKSQSHHISCVHLHRGLVAAILDRREINSLPSYSILLGWLT